jgi:hypothetical protein
MPIRIESFFASIASSTVASTNSPHSTKIPPVVVCLTGWAKLNRSVYTNISMGGERTSVGDNVGNDILDFSSIT